MRVHFAVIHLVQDDENVNSKQEKRLNSGNFLSSADMYHTPHICYKVKGRMPILL